MRRLAVIVAFAIALTGCTSGPEYKSVESSIPSLALQQARIIFFRQSNWAGGVATLRVQIDGTTVGYLPNGSLLRIDHAPGDLYIRVERSGIFDEGHADLELVAATGQEYYLEAGTTSDCNPLLLGYVGCPLATMQTGMSASVDHCGGGWCVGARSVQYARPKLGSLSVQTPKAD